MQILVQLGHRGAQLALNRPGRMDMSLNTRGKGDSTRPVEAPGNVTKFMETVKSPPKSVVFDPLGLTVTLVFCGATYRLPATVLNEV